MGGSSRKRGGGRWRRAIVCCSCEEGMRAPANGAYLVDVLQEDVEAAVQLQEHQRCTAAAVGALSRLLVLVLAPVVDVLPPVNTSCVSLPPQEC